MAVAEELGGHFTPSVEETTRFSEDTHQQDQNMKYPQILSEFLNNPKPPAEIKDGTINGPKVCLIDALEDQSSRGRLVSQAAILHALVGKCVESVEFVNEIDPVNNPDGAIGFFRIKVSPTRPEPEQSV